MSKYVIGQEVISTMEENCVAEGNRECQGRCVCIFNILYTVVTERVGDIREEGRRGQNDVVPLRLREPGPGHHVQHHDRENAWILEKLETTGLVWSKQ